jgi:predicted TIM-barrel fold metal-dependent hydrolase
MRIDFHCHAFPGGFFRAAKHFYPDAIELGHDEQKRLVATWAGTGLPAWDHAGRLADIDRAGIDIGILSCPPVYSRVDEHAPELCRLVNDAIAAACRRNPQRFRGFAHLPFNNMKLALEEMRRALDELGFVGVLVTSNIGGRYLDSVEYYPFWEEANRRGMPVFMHPSNSPCYRDDQPGPLLSFPFDTTLSVYKLIYGGLYERFHDIVLVLAHLGGTLPFLAPTEAEIQAIESQASSAVAAAVTSALGIGYKLLTFLGLQQQDDLWGDVVTYYTASQLVASSPKGIPVNDGIYSGAAPSPNLPVFTFKGMVVADPLPLSMRRIMTGIGHAPPVSIRSVMGSPVTPSLLAWINKVR